MCMLPSQPTTNYHFHRISNKCKFAPQTPCPIPPTIVTLSCIPFRAFRLPKPIYAMLATSEKKERIIIGYTKSITSTSNQPSHQPFTTHMHHRPSPTLHINPSNNPINPLRNKVARETETKQTSRNAPEPDQIALVLLTRHPDVHAPHASDDVHGQDDGSEDGEFAENVGGLLGALVHADVDLGEVVAVGAGEEAVILC
jgi:hypothetical protein